MVGLVQEPELVLEQELALVLGQEPGPVLEPELALVLEPEPGPVEHSLPGPY